MIDNCLGEIHEVGGTIQGDDREFPSQLHQPGHRAVVQHREGEDLQGHQSQSQSSREQGTVPRAGQSSAEATQS